MKVKRHRSVEATYDTLVRDSAVDGGWRWEHIVQAYEGFWAQVFQHEIDHLDGKLFVDALPERKRIEIANFIRKKR
jgi:peptide deformylase